MPAKKALEYYGNGMCCSESVVKATAEYLGLKDVDKLVNISSALCGGMGVSSVCGVMTGCAMVIGACTGKAGDSDRKTAKLAGSVLSDFTEKHSTVNCKELISGFEKGSAEQKKFCGSLIQQSVELALKKLEAK